MTSFLSTVTSRSDLSSAACTPKIKLSVRTLIYLDRLSNLSGDRVRALDLVLKLDDTVEQCFCSRRTTRHIDVYRDDSVASANDGVRVVVVATAVGT